MIIIDGKKYGGPCSCGRNHEMVTKLAVIQNGCLGSFDTYMEEAGLLGKRCAVYDSNTYNAKGLRRPPALQEIILPPENLHADERATALLLEQLEPDVDVLIAVGSGTIHDIVRYCASEQGISFVSCPTAASVDGFCSTVSAMTWKGFKKTIPGVAPVIVLADTQVLCQAPLYLALSGVGDIIGKYTALLDWNISHLLTGEKVCRKIEGMTRQAAEAVHSSCRQAVKREPEAVEKLTYALLLSGLAMQMMGNSRPASGSEHHISHFIEMEPAGVPVHSDSLHGEKVGVGAVLAAQEYHRLAQIVDIRPYIHPYKPGTEELFTQIFGPSLAPSIIEENKNNCMDGITPEKLAECWPDIRKLIASLPTVLELEELYREIGAKRTLNDIGVDEALLPKLLDYSPFVRNRLTFMRVRQMINGGVL